MDKNKFLLWEQASRDTIDFKKVYVDIVNDLIAGLLLSQIVYWNLPSREGKTKLRVNIDGELWLAKGREDWWDECRITAKQFDRAAKILINKGIIEKKLKKFDGIPMMHIRLDFDVLLNEIENVLNKQEIEVKQENIEGSPDLPKGQNRISPKVKTGFDERVKSITENTNREYKHRENRKEKIKENMDNRLNNILSPTDLSDESEEINANDSVEKEITPGIIPIEFENRFDIAAKNRFKAAREFYGIDFNTSVYYNLFADALVKTQLQDNVETITFIQYHYFASTLKKMLDESKELKFKYE